MVAYDDASGADPVADVRSGKIAAYVNDLPVVQVWRGWGVCVVRFGLCVGCVCVRAHGGFLRVCCWPKNARANAHARTHTHTHTHTNLFPLSLT